MRFILVIPLHVVRASRPLWRERPAPRARAGCPRHGGRDARITKSRFAQVRLVNLLGCAERPRQGHSRVGVACQRHDAIVLRAGQGVLRRYNLDVVRYAIAEAVLCQSEFPLRKRQGRFCNAHLISGGIEVEQRLPQVLFDSSSEVVNL